ncbi:hypothetical protein WJX81_008691 [Elliptochloris bilobata]|uniref:NEK6-subfamily protein kinase n=1 Tax=Elliptochloris bilobata TaxID=381761 RepID=A0AAW1SM80_9CHLO
MPQLLVQLLINASTRSIAQSFKLARAFVEHAGNVAGRTPAHAGTRFAAVAARQALQGAHVTVAAPCRAAKLLARQVGGALSSTRDTCVAFVIATGEVVIQTTKRLARKLFAPDSPLVYALTAAAIVNLGAALVPSVLALRAGAWALGRAAAAVAYVTGSRGQPPVQAAAGPAAVLQRNAEPEASVQQLLPPPLAADDAAGNCVNVLSDDVAGNLGCALGGDASDNSDNVPGGDAADGIGNALSGKEPDTAAGKIIEENPVLCINLTPASDPASAAAALQPAASGLGTLGHAAPTAAHEALLRKLPTFSNRPQPAQAALPPATQPCNSGAVLAELHDLLADLGGDAVDNPNDIAAGAASPAQDPKLSTNLTPASAPASADAALQPAASGSGTLGHAAPTAAHEAPPRKPPTFRDRPQPAQAALPPATQPCDSGAVLTELHDLLADLGGPSDSEASPRLDAPVEMPAGMAAAAQPPDAEPLPAFSPTSTESHDHATRFITAPMALQLAQPVAIPVAQPVAIPVAPPAALPLAPPAAVKIPEFKLAIDANSELFELMRQRDEARRCARAAAQKQADLQVIAGVQAAESARLWALSMLACASTPRLAVSTSVFPAPGFLPPPHTWTRLGRGGFSTVFRVPTANVRALGASAVAVKVASLASQYASGAVYNELAALTLCAGHPAVPAVLGTASGFELPSDVVEPEAFLEYSSVSAPHALVACFGMLLPALPGCSLTSLLERRVAEGGRQSAFSMLEVLTVVQKVADALAHVHASGVVHNDIKPDNLMVEVDATGCVSDVRLIDFGIAALLPGLTTADPARRHAFWVSEFYAAPEVRADQTTLWAAADVYALYLTALQIMAGQTMAAYHSNYQRWDAAGMAAWVDAQTGASAQAAGDLVELLEGASRADPAKRSSAADLAYGACSIRDNLQGMLDDWG